MTISQAFRRVGDTPIGLALISLAVVAASTSCGLAGATGPAAGRSTPLTTVRDHKTDPAAPEIKATPTRPAPARTVVEVLPPPNPQELTVGHASAFTVYLGCPTVGFTLHGHPWVVTVPVRQADRYRQGTLTRVSINRAVFRDAFGSMTFIPGVTACPS